MDSFRTLSSDTMAVDFGLKDQERFLTSFHIRFPCNIDRFYHVNIPVSSIMKENDEQPKLPRHGRQYN